MKRLNDAGFTLVELTISILIIGVVVPVIGGALIFGLKTFGTTSQRLNESHDLQLAASYFASDVQSAKTVSLTADPSCPVSGSAVVTLTWTAVSFTGGSGVPGYVVKRYDGLTNALQTVLAGCSGLVATTGCTENGVPTGTWKYTITPAAGSKWRGTESGQSAAVVVLL